jgi:hypothetical protein
MLCVDIHRLADDLEAHTTAVQGSMRDSLRRAAGELRRRADSIAASLT